MVFISGYRKGGINPADEYNMYGRTTGPGGLLYFYTPERERMLLKNPDSRRYREYSGVNGLRNVPDSIGYKADPYENEFVDIPRLENIGGLLGLFESDSLETKSKLREVTSSNRSYELGYEDPSKVIIYEKDDSLQNKHDQPDHVNRSEFGTAKFAEDIIFESKEKKTVYIDYDEGGADYSVNSRNNTYKSGNYNRYEDYLKSDGTFKPGTSILRKTQKLFDDEKINSIVSRFTVKDGTETLSRGRKLKATYRGAVNGFDNPYCRVWTSHHQYDKIKNLMTPYRYSTDTFGYIYSTEDLHKKLGPDMRPNRAPTRLNTFTAKNDLGITKVAPKRPDEVKKCMFSIENLAWKDIMNNALVDGRNKTLTKEQTGPNGGRIMWFPPYNLRFTEQINTRWEQNEFIGRGEKINTYVNTERTGTLDFSILVDHPSRINKWAKERGEVDSNDEYNVNELLRYLAGIDVIKTPGKETKGDGIPEKISEPSRDWTPGPSDRPVKIYTIFFPNNYSGFYDDVDTVLDKLYRGYNEISGYEQSDSGIDTYEYTSGYPMNQVYEDTDVRWRYWIDYNENDKRKKRAYCYEKLKLETNYRDTTGYSLNSMEAYSAETNNKDIIAQLGLDSFSGIALGGIGDIINDLSQDEKFVTALTNGELRFLVEGRASEAGHVDRNVLLASDRADSIIKILNTFVDGEHIKKTVPVGGKGGDGNVSSKVSKIARSVVVKVYHSGSTDPTLTQSNASDIGSTVETKVAQDVKEMRVKYEVLKNNPNIAETVKAKTLKQMNEDYDDDSYIYDNEYLYFNEIYQENEIVKKNIVEKVKYFHPAFHSITPEGFNARLTFLQQCMRQGPTVSAADRVGDPAWAGNLAFGRAPYCVLRIGDFYNTKICINNINITYEGDGNVMWDLNQDGIGIQPMIANISMSFTFIGGQDLSGPIARLQNAVSYNYYANTSVYDRHSDYRDGYISDKVEGEHNGDAAWIWEPVMTGDNDILNNKNHYMWGTTPGYKAFNEEPEYNYEVEDEDYKRMYSNSTNKRPSILGTVQDLSLNVKGLNEEMANNVKSIKEAKIEGRATNLDKLIEEYTQWKKPNKFNI